MYVKVAMLACTFDTQEDIRTLVAKWDMVMGDITPNPGKAAYCDSRFLEYVKLYPAMKALAQARESVECWELSERAAGKSSGSLFSTLCPQRSEGR